LLPAMAASSCASLKTTFSSAAMRRASGKYSASVAALNQAQNGLVEEFERLLKNAEIRQARIYLDTYSKARDEGIDELSAQARANNALTRAALRRVDGQEVWARLTPRDKEILEMEQALKQRMIDTMTEEERKEYLEQQEILDEMEAFWKKKQKALRRL